MRILLPALLFGFIYYQAGAQAFEGMMQIDYRSLSGSKSAADIYVKGNRFYIKKVYGGPDRYEGYIFDAGTHTLTCLSPQSPKTALSFDINKILGIFESRQLKPSFQIHKAWVYQATSVSRKTDAGQCTEKKAIAQDTLSVICTKQMDINFQALVPVLRLIGYWGEAEDSNSVILDSKVTIRHTPKNSTSSLNLIEMKVEDAAFKIPENYQQVDLDKFLVNEYKSPRYGDLVRAFTGF